MYNPWKATASGEEWIVSDLIATFSRNFSKMAQRPRTIDRDEVVETVSNFYTFLTTHPFLPASSIKKPPSEGWPEEYCEIWRKMSRAEEVIDLLAHLPYIDDANWL